ncbi:hypothetical protein BB560_000341 [Smittium megazygosporum]|uniref:3-dehydrosphinganine reductase n=1 Tax=Smittium megazygosporum TaxID=133381 RepID=A0A2T9ZKM6_9FUNG|nr:hypothetical protein BB560_000341 [Smittium megazygosporum]
MILMIVFGVLMGTLGVFYEIVARRNVKNVNLRDKVCYVTGGSSGLGLALAKELFKNGATITIVSRRVSELEKAVSEIEICRVNETQKVFYVSADCTNYQETLSAIEESKTKTGEYPEYVFTCAGASYPGFFIDQDVSIFEKNMQLNYFGTLYTIHECAKKMVENNVKGKLVLVGSTLSMMSFAGFSQYSPTKYAVRGLADTLRNELKAYGISVHLYLPGTILSPGLESEVRTGYLIFFENTTFLQKTWFVYLIEPHETENH